MAQSEEATVKSFYLEPYIDLNRSISTRFPMLKNYRLFSSAIQVPLRLELTGYGGYYKEVWQFYSGNCSGLLLKKRARLVYDKLIALYVFFRAKKADIIMSVSRAPAVQESVQYNFSDKDTLTGYAARAALKKLEDDVYRKLFSKNEFSKMQDSGLSSFLCDEQFLKEKEVKVRELVSDLSKRIAGMGVSLVLSHDFHSPFGFVLASACAELDILSVEVGHGFPRDKRAITILPINADYYLSWSRNYVDYISEVEPDSKNKLISIGFPYVKICTPSQKSGKRKAAFIMPSLAGRDTADQEKIISNVEEAVNAMSMNKKFHIYLRPHPFDFNKHLYSTSDILRKLDYIDGQVCDWLCDFDLVLGGVSTVLHEALVNEIPSIQVTELGGLQLPSIRQVNIASLVNIDFDSLKCDGGSSDLVYNSKVVLDLLKKAR